MNYVTKLGAYGLAGVAAFAVAVALMLSASSTSTVEASIEDTATGTGGPTSATKNNGDTVYILNSAGTEYVRFEIETTGAASASFTHSDAADDGQSILCRDAADTATGNCDADPAGAGVAVALKIDDDSGKGVIFVKQTTVPATGTPTVTTDTITVEVAQVPTSLAVSASPTSINSGQGSAEAGTTTISVRLTDADGKGIAGEGLTVIASHGTLAAPQDQPRGWRRAAGKGLGGGGLTVRASHGPLAAATDQPSGWPARDVTATGDGNGLAFGTGGTQVGTLTTSTDGGDNSQDGAGYAAVTLTGGGAPGTATVTVRLTAGTLAGTTDVVLFGPAKTISAEAEQSAIAIGESTNIVVTVVDAGGNPVTRGMASVKSQGGVVAPTKLGTPVATANDVNKDTKGDRGELDKGDIPSCVAHAVVAADENADPPVLAEFESFGTNSAGQCVIKVTATDDTSSLNNDASRGVHTITIVGSAGGTDPRGIDAVTVEIQVGGAPAIISSDAPERLDPSAELTVNITVVDDEDVRVGKVAIEVIQTAGDGKIITEAGANTSDGRAKFTYLAPSTPGVAEFLVRTKSSTGAVTSQLPIIIAIAEEAPPEPPAPPEPEASISGAVPSASGESGLVIIDNVDDTAELAALFSCDAPTVTLSSDSGLVRFVASAPDFVNAPFNASGVLPTSGPTPAFATCE